MNRILFHKIIREAKLQFYSMHEKGLIVKEKGSTVELMYLDTNDKTF